MQKGCGIRERNNVYIVFFEHNSKDAMFGTWQLVLLHRLAQSA